VWTGKQKEWCGEGTGKEKESVESGQERKRKKDVKRIIGHQKKNENSRKE